MACVHKYTGLIVMDVGIQINSDHRLATHRTISTNKILPNLCWLWMVDAFFDSQTKKRCKWLKDACNLDSMLRRRHLLQLSIEAESYSTVHNHVSREDCHKKTAIPSPIKSRRKKLIPSGRGMDDVLIEFREFSELNKFKQNEPIPLSRNAWKLPKETIFATDQNELTEKKN